MTLGKGGAVVGIMQPYFFPYLGYFSLIRHVDRFILFDPVQFIRHGWIDRNRILKDPEGWIYIRPDLVPFGHGVPIRDVRLDNAKPWRQRILSQLGVYRRRAPHFWKVRKLVEDAISGEHDTIVSLNRATLEAVCAYLGMARRFEVLSEMNLSIDPPTAPDEWALNICKALGNVSEYWNPPGGQAFFDRSKYEDAGIALRFQKPRLSPYDQKREPFEAGLSIIDVLMFNSPEEVNAMLDEYELV